MLRLDWSPQKLTTAFAIGTAAGGQLELLESIVKEHPIAASYYPLLARAIRGGHVHIVRYLRHLRGDIFDYHARADALISGHRHMIALVGQRDIYGNYQHDEIQRAMLKGCREDMEWLTKEMPMLIAH
jgi:hypothetical protein